MNNKEWFAQAKFGLMIHWGLYALPAGEWRGQRIDYIGEWLQSRFRIPNREYHPLAQAFNPIEFRAEDWARLAKDCGMQYLVVTAKHHEGFALYHSKVSDFNLYDATPFRRDAIAELAEACYKHGIKLGLYYSQDLDWSDPNGGGYTLGHTNLGMSWTNDWDFPNADKKDFSLYFENKAKPQVQELLTNYGDICLIWFDTPCTMTTAQSQELYDMVKHYQPDCLVNSRIGNGLGDYSSMGDNQIPDDFMTDGLFESPATLNRTWGYKSFDNDWKSAQEVLRIKRHLNDRGLNYLLNVGPDGLGRIPAPAQNILREVGKIG